MRTTPQISTSTADISVIIPVKDRPNELKRAVQSVLAQTLLPRELIIVDDCSVNPVTHEMSGSMDAPIPVRILRNRANVGGARSINAGIQISSSDIIAFLDSDDVYHSCYIDRISQVWSRLPSSVGCLACSCWWCTDEMRPYKVHTPKIAVDTEMLLSQGNVLGGNSMLSLRRNVLELVGEIPVTRSAYDWGMLIAVSRKASIATYGEPLVFYRSPSASRLPNLTRSPRVKIVSLLKIFRSLSASEKAVARQQIRRKITQHLVESGQHQRARRFLLAQKPTSLRADIILVAMLLVGGRAVHYALGRYAQLRAFLLSVVRSFGALAA